MGGTRLTVDDERARVVNLFDIELQAERLQTPTLAVRDSLARRGDVRLGEEEPAKPDLDVVEAVERCDVVELREAAREVGDPLRHAHRLVHLVLAPVRGDGAFRDGERGHVGYTRD